MFVIGVDPGATGAVVGLLPNGKILFCLDTKGIGDSRGLHILPIPSEEESAELTPLAVVERQQYMRKGGKAQGARSAFSLGKSYGFWLGFFDANGIKTITLLPQEWRRFFFSSGAVIYDTKELSIREAKRRFPDLDLVPPRGRVPSHGRADAALIALYGMNLAVKGDSRV